MGSYVNSDPNMDDDARRHDKWGTGDTQTNGQAGTSGTGPAESGATAMGQADGATEPATGGGAHSAPGGQPATARPAGNASREDWADYAVANGHTEAGIEGMSRDELRGLFA